MIGRRGAGPPLVIGHRGAAALAPANTLASLERAVEAGVDAVELDVLALRDGTIVLAHSRDLWDVSHGTVRGRVPATLAELRLAAPRLPTLDEALELLAPAPAGVWVDLKWTGFEAEVVDALRRHQLVGRALVGSCFARSLRKVRELEPALQLALSYPRDRAGVSRYPLLTPAVLAALLAMRQALPRRLGRWLDRSGAEVAALHHLVLSRAAVRRCHARDVPVVAWTVDRPVAARRAVALGVDGIITNDPAGISAATLGT